MLDGNTFNHLSMQDVEACPLCGSRYRKNFEIDSSKEHAVRIVQCDECRLIYLNRVVASDHLSVLDKSYNATRNRKLTRLHKQRNVMYRIDRDFVNQYRSSRHRSVLDIGCGQGEFLSMFPGIKQYGLEIDTEAVATARKRCPQATIFTTFAEIPKRQRFDMLIFRGTLQYMPDLSFVSEFCGSRVNKNGLLFLLATPNADSVLAHLQKEYWALSDKLEHRYCFGIEQIRRLFRRNFSLTHYDLPYLGTPYEDYPNDLAKLLEIIEHGTGRSKRFPFFGSMINAVLTKAR